MPNIFINSDSQVGMPKSQTIWLILKMGNP